GNGRGRPIVIRTREAVDPARPEALSHNLPWETSDPVWILQTTAPATRRDRAGGVSRGHSSRGRPRRRAEPFHPRSQPGTTGWARSGSQAGPTNGPSTSRAWRRPRATPGAATTASDLPGPRSHKRPRRPTQHEP